MQNNLYPKVKSTGNGVAYFGLATLFGVTSLLILSGAGVNAQSDVSPTPVQVQPGSPTSASLQELVQQKKNEMGAREAAQSAWSNSLPAKLGLDARQTTRLDALYDNYARRRMEQEARIVGWQQELRQAQSPTNFNERKASELLRSITGAQENIRNTFLRARGEALKALTTAQRARLQAMTMEVRASTTQSQDSGLLPLRNDQYNQLLLMPLEHLLQTPIDVQTGRRLLAERANGHESHSSYGYDDYNPFGVYGRYGRGRSSIGISIGGGFGGYWGHRHRFGIYR
jgi:hypothetical protein